MISTDQTHGGQLLHILIRSSQGSQPNLLRELSKAGVTEERDVPKQFVADVWFGRVHWLGAVANVLSGVEHSESEPSEKIT